MYTTHNYGYQLHAISYMAIAIPYHCIGTSTSNSSAACVPELVMLIMVASVMPIASLVPSVLLAIVILPLITIKYTPLPACCTV